MTVTFFDSSAWRRWKSAVAGNSSVSVSPSSAAGRASARSDATGIERVWTAGMIVRCHASCSWSSASGGPSPPAAGAAGSGAGCGATGVGAAAVAGAAVGGAEDHGRGRSDGCPRQPLLELLDAERERFP